MEDISNNHKVLSMQKTANDMISHPTDCFASVMQESSIVSGEMISIAPDGILTDSGPYYFSLPKNGRYIHGPGCLFYLQFQILKADGSKLTNDDSCSFINNIASSFIQEIEVYIGHQLIPELTNTNVGHKSYLEYCMSFGEDARRSHLKTTSVFIMDTAGHFDSMAPTRDANNAIPENGAYANQGFEGRRKLATLSKSVQCLVQFPLDFLKTCKFIPAGLTMAFKVKRATDEFLLMSDHATEKYKMHIEKMELDLHYLDPADHIISDHQRKLQAGQFIMLPFNKTIIKTFINSVKTSTYDERNLFFGTLPKVALIGIMPHANFNGTMSTNGLHFTNQLVKNLYLKINGGNQIPQNGYSQDFSKDLCVRSFRTFQNNIGVNYRDVGNSIDYALWMKGITIYSFDLTPDSCAGFHRHEKREGHIDLHIEFDTTPTVPLVIVAIGVYDAVMGIDKGLNIRVDY